MDLLLMEEILHQVGCEKPCKWWDKVPINRWRIFFHQQYHKPQEISKKIWYLRSGRQNDGTFQVHHLDKCFRTPVIRSDPWSIWNYDVTQLGRYWKICDNIWCNDPSNYPSRRFLFDHVLGLGTGEHCPFQFVALPCVCCYCMDGWWSTLLSESGVLVEVIKVRCIYMNYDCIYRHRDLHMFIYVQYMWHNMLVNFSLK